MPSGFEYAFECEVFHNTFAPYHASGCQDNAGKTPRIEMIREIGFKQQSIYCYHTCYVSAVTPPMCL